jgi:hypothetical protein
VADQYAALRPAASELSRNQAVQHRVALSLRFTIAGVP